MRVNIAVWWVLDYETGERETLGGLERWTRDIVLELKSEGHDVTIYQKSKVSYVREYYGVKIVGIPCSRNFIGNFIFYSKFRNLVDHDDLTLFISQDLIFGKDFGNSLAINHGVWWSSHQSKIKRFILEYLNNRYISATSRTICVDTNYINWVIESVPNGYKLASKLIHVPNYYDSRQFCFVPRVFEHQEIKILFPRRIMGIDIHSEPRGGEDAIRAVAALIKEGYDIKLTMLGEGNLAFDLKNIIKNLDIVNSVNFSVASFNDIHTYYSSHDVVLIPSRFSEGTSLSAIEGLASGCYVIGSCVGGLQNLPLFEPFGDMVEPSPMALARAIKKYIRIRKTMKPRTHLLQKAIMDRFEMNNWKKSIFEIIHSRQDI